VVVMLRWDGFLARAFDVAFGVFPALYYLGFSVIGILFSISAMSLSQEKLLAGGFLVMSLFGLGACCSVIYVTVARGKTRYKKVNAMVLGIGILVYAILMIDSVPQSFIYESDFNLSKILVVFSGVPLYIVAVKHIFLLSRVSEVQP
jgi:hypothetical protein